MKAQNFGETWIDIDLPFPCEIHHNRIRCIPENQTFKVLNLVGEPQIMSMTNEQVLASAHLFDLVLTHRPALQNLPNVQFMVFGSSWITTLPKVKRYEVSFLYSGGVGGLLDGYTLRNKIWGMKHRLKMPIKFWTSIVPGRIPQVPDLNPYPGENKATLFESMYSIIVENTAEPHYFTEKIVDAFRTFTLPLYYGNQTISEYFNSDGILTFFDVESLIEQINDQSEQHYWTKMRALIDNFNRSETYIDFVQRLKFEITKHA